MFFIAGFPRSGSTLLSSVLYQNPLIYAEGKSILCQIMWDMEQSMQELKEYLRSNNREKTEINIISNLPKNYYQDVDRPIIFDKNPWWTNINNRQLISKYIEKDFKMIVLYRRVDEVLKSHISVYRESNVPVSEKPLETFPGTIYNATDLFNLIESGSLQNYLFIDYNKMISDMEKTIKNIYSFFEIENFNHTYENIVKIPMVEKNFFGLKNLYEVRSKIEKRENNIELDAETMLICEKINEKIYSYQDRGII